MCRFSCCARRWPDPNDIPSWDSKARDSRPTQGLRSASLHREGQVKGLGKAIGQSRREPGIGGEEEPCGFWRGLAVLATEICGSRPLTVETMEIAAQWHWLENGCLDMAELF